MVSENGVFLAMHTNFVYCWHWYRPMNAFGRWSAKKICYIAFGRWWLRLVNFALRLFIKMLIKILHVTENVIVVTHIYGILARLWQWFINKNRNILLHWTTFLEFVHSKHHRRVNEQLVAFIPKNALLFPWTVMILHLLRMRRIVSRIVFNDQKKM